MVPHLESADPTEADDDDAVDDAVAVADDDEDDAAADNTPEREGMERKGTERDKAFSTRPANDYQSFWD